MSSPRSHPARLLLAAVTVLAACAGATPALAAGPLAAKQLSVQPACSAPLPGRAACMALGLVRAGTAGSTPAQAAQPQSGAPSPASGSVGYTPQELHVAYDLPTSGATGQTIALVDAYNDPTAEADLNEYSRTLGLPECTSENGCFAQYNQQGHAHPLPYPATTAELETGLASSNEATREEAEEAEGWGEEISLDIETAHAICQNCKIDLVESASPGFNDFETAENSAARLGATEISNSWGGQECYVDGLTTECDEDSSAFDHPGVVITASAGDDGYLDWDREQSFERGFANYPASSPDVVAVGGTHLELVSGVGTWQGERVWNGWGASGGGCSHQLPAQPWQKAVSDWAAVGCGEDRAVADVAADADPYTGVVVHYSRPECAFEYEVGQALPGWCPVGGTSLSSPLIAAVYALAGGGHAVAYPARTLYEGLTSVPGSLHDVTGGANGECTRGYNRRGLSACTESEDAAQCSRALICLAHKGYDGPTGVGTPDGLLAFVPGSTEPLQTVTGPVPEAPDTTPPAAQEPAPSAPAPVTVPTGTGAPGGSPAVVLSRLGLTKRARTALAGQHPLSRAIAFQFTLTAATKVKVSLERRVDVHGHLRWRAVGRALTIAAAAGHDHAALHGARHLPAGLYRLTLSPSGGSARAIQISLR